METLHHPVVRIREIILAIIIIPYQGLGTFALARHRNC